MVLHSLLIEMEAMHLFTTLVNNCKKPVPRNALMRTWDGPLHQLHLYIGPVLGKGTVYSPR
jgi:hypothetical protein